MEKQVRYQKEENNIRSLEKIKQDIKILKKIKQEIEAYLKNKNTIVIGCECTATYSGRAEAFLALGDRLILIKADRTVLLHQPSGATPVNYMKNAIIRVNIEEGKLVITCEDVKLLESLKIKISKIHFLNSYNLKDNEKISLAGKEQDMRDYLMKNPRLIENGFKPLNREEHTRYGFIDIFGYDNNGVLTVVECKRYKAGLEAVQQLRRYVEKIKTSKGVLKVRGILAAPDITGNALIMLRDFGFEFKKINPPRRLDISNKQARLESFLKKQADIKTE